jgi:hypothetical protein
MQILERDGFTREQVILALHCPNIRIDFRYELLDKFGRRKKDLFNIRYGEVSHDTFATIKRTARFTMTEDNDIDYLSDRIKPFVRLFIPSGRSYGNYYGFYSQQFAPLLDEVKSALKTGWAEFPLGEFLLSSPTRKQELKHVIRDIEAYDPLVILTDDKFTDRYTVLEGTSYRQAAIDILIGTGITKYHIPDSDKVLEMAIEFEPGKEKLYAVNQLLRAINYEPIHVDVNGYFVSLPYRSPADRAAEYSYITDSSSVTFGGMSEELDLFNIPNKFVVIRTNAEQEPLRAEYTNSNLDSPVSTVNRNRTIVDYREIDNIADQASLDSYVQRIAFEASQVYGKIQFETAIMPFHDYSDVLDIDFTDLGIKGKYAETSWSFPLQVGGRMRHEVRKVVAI